MKKITDKFAKQKKLILDTALRKIKSLRTKNHKELSNQEIDKILFNYSQEDSYDDDTLEWLHSKLATLNEIQMSILRKRYWEGKSLTIIANEFGKLNDHKWAIRQIESILAILRK